MEWLCIYTSFVIEFGRVKKWKWSGEWFSVDTINGKIEKLKVR